jgi:hypothetical protein
MAGRPPSGWLEGSAGEWLVSFRPHVVGDGLATPIAHAGKAERMARCRAIPTEMATTA